MVNNGMIMGWLGWLKAKKDHVPPNGWLKHVEKPQKIGNICGMFMDVYHLSARMSHPSGKCLHSY